MIRRRPRVFFACVLLYAVLASGLRGVAQELSANERQSIAFEAERAFAHILRLWKDGRFAELYAFGTFASQSDLSPEAFVRYMHYATRTLQCCWSTLQDVRSRFVSPDQVYVQARIGFKNKEFLVIRGQHRIIARGFVEEETLTFLLERDAETWHIDLFRVLALSGVPLDVRDYVYPRWRPY